MSASKKAGGETTGIWRRAVGGLLRFLYPPRCPFCGDVTGDCVRACTACLGEIPIIRPPLCPVCGAGKERCSCRGTKHACSGCVGAVYYEGKGAFAARRFKFQCGTETAEFLGGMLAAAVVREYGEDSFDLVTAVPLHRSSRRRRGANPSELLARQIAHRLETPYEPLLIKAVRTPPQRSLAASQRAGNVLGVFVPVAGADLSGKRILLVDDIRTTGATLDECARTLRLYGAAEVRGAAFAVATRKREKGRGQHG